MRYMKVGDKVWPFWEVIFTDPDDSAWHLVSNTNGTHGLSHDCEPEHAADCHDGPGCGYCGELPSDSLQGLFNLCAWGEEDHWGMNYENM